MKRLLQLLLSGEPEPLAQPEYRYYMGIDLGVQDISVAVVGHVENAKLQVDHFRQWNGWHFGDHEREIGSILDAYEVDRGWADHFNSRAVVDRFPCLTQVKARSSNLAKVQRVGRYVVTQNLVSEKSPKIPGKPSDYFHDLLECVRHIHGEEPDVKQEDIDHYLTAFALMMWGAATFETDWIGSSTIASI